MQGSFVLEGFAVQVVEETARHPADEKGIGVDGHIRTERLGRMAVKRGRPTDQRQDHHPSPKAFHHPEKPPRAIVSNRSRAELPWASGHSPLTRQRASGTI